jgi:hypothetical protein
LFSRWRTVVARTLARFKILGWVLIVAFIALSLLQTLVRWRMGHSRTHKETIAYYVVSIVGFLVFYIFMMDEDFQEAAPVARFFKVLVPLCVLLRVLGAVRHAVWLFAASAGRPYPTLRLR